MTSQPRTPLTVEEIPGGTQSPTPHGGQRDSGTRLSEGSLESIPGQVEPFSGVSRRTLGALLSRVMRADGPDRELDGALWLNIEPAASLARCGFRGSTYAGHKHTKAEKAAHIRRVAAYSAPEFTASLDAALAIVGRLLPGWRWGVSVEPPAHGVTFHAFVAEHFGLGLGDAPYMPTPALALIAALLKALIAQGKADTAGRQAKPREA